MSCKYSLIIPIYQVKEYLVQCLESIFCQIPQDVQVILVDDGSTDGSGDICDEYAQRYPQIEVIHQENKGVAAARNAGLAAAKGEYLLWVDPDDWVSEDWFESISSKVERYAPDVVVFDSMRVFKNKQKAEIYGQKTGFVDKDLFCNDLACDIKMLSGLPNKVIKHVFFSEACFDTTINILEDYSAIFGILKNTKTIYYLDKILYFYRQNDHSLLHSYSPERSFRCVELALQRKENIEKKYQKAAIIGAAVQAFFFCRASAYDVRFSTKSKQYRICKQYIQQHIFFILNEACVPFKWKIKFFLMSIGVLNAIVKLKHFFGNAQLQG